MSVFDRREKVFRAALATFWVTSSALAVVLAVRSRDDFYATVHPQRGGVTLVVLTTVPALVAVMTIRSRAILLVTFVVSGSWSVVGNWDVMRDESSTAALGVIAIPMMALFLVLLGTALDYIRRRRESHVAG